MFDQSLTFDIFFQLLAKQALVLCLEVMYVTFLKHK